MGVKVSYLPDRQAVYRLIIYCKAPPELACSAFSMNKALAAELVRWEPERRTMRLEGCVVKLLETLPEQAVIKDIDVLFHPNYQVDVLKLLVSAYKRRAYSLIWPGKCSDGRLIYSEEGCLDHKVYEIKDYDVMCVV